MPKDRYTHQTKPKRFARNVVVLVVLLVLIGCASIERLAIPKKKLISPELEQSGTEDTISHAIWDEFLRTYAIKDPQGVVRLNYASVSDRHRQNLRVYLAQLSTAGVARQSKNAQLAYWANLYNAKTVDIILDHYPVASIRDVKEGLFDIGPWEEKRLNLHSGPASLHDIEHGIVRPLWSQTPEIHYVLNCAAAGCPNLPQRAFTGANIQELMHQAAIAYINDSVRGVRVRNDGRLTLSKIYAWYRGDFGGADSKILGHLRRYAAPDLKARIDAGAAIHGYSYDWSLNDGKS